MNQLPSYLLGILFLKTLLLLSILLSILFTIFEDAAVLMKLKIRLFFKMVCKNWTGTSMVWIVQMSPSIPVLRFPVKLSHTFKAYFDITLFLSGVDHFVLRTFWQLTFYIFASPPCRISLPLSSSSSSTSFNCSISVILIPLIFILDGAYK